MILRIVLYSLKNIILRGSKFSRLFQESIVQNTKNFYPGEPIMYESKESVYFYEGEQLTYSESLDPPTKLRCYIFVSSEMTFMISTDQFFFLSFHAKTNY